MKAAFLEDIKKISVKEIEKPKIGKEEILVKIEACAICGSDKRVFNSGSHRISYPHIIGHEISGEVVESGGDVKGFEIGDRLSLSADIPCGYCEWCKSGLENNCKDTIALGWEYQGGFCEYLKLDKRILDFGPVVKIPEEVSFDAACLAEPLACCINGMESVNMEKRKSVLIIGAGPTGCLLSMLSNVYGASKVIICDSREERVNLAHISEPDYIIDSKKDNLETEVMKITQNKGVDIVFTACSNIDAQYTAFKVIRNRGYINLFGGLPENSEKLNIDSNLIHYKELRVVGSHGSTPRHHRTAVNLITSGKVKIEKLITKRYPLEEINKAFTVGMEDWKNLKIIIKPTLSKLSEEG